MISFLRVCVCVFKCRSGRITPRWSSEVKVQTPPANTGLGPAGPGAVSFLSDPVFSHSRSVSPTSSPSPPTCSSPSKIPAQATWVFSPSLVTSAWLSDAALDTCVSCPAPWTSQPSTTRPGLPSAHCHLPVLGFGLRSSPWGGSSPHCPRLMTTSSRAGSR